MNTKIIIIMINMYSGFDGHKADPTEGGMRLTKAEYRHVTEQLKAVAKRYPKACMVVLVHDGHLTLSTPPTHHKPSN